MPFSFRRPLTSYTRVRRAIAGIRRNRSWLIDQRSIRGKEYLDLGCGPNVHPHFINLDYGWCPGTDISWDITRGLPLQSGTMKGVFSEHCFEHLPFESMGGVLAECYRVLRPGGTLRIVVPDGELYLTLYTDIVRGLSAQALPYSESEQASDIYGPIVSVNRIFHGHGHRFIYDFDTLRQLLEKHGFTDIRKERYRSGRDATLLIDTEVRAIESLYVEASVQRPAEAARAATLSPNAACDRR